MTESEPKRKTIIEVLEDKSVGTKIDGPPYMGGFMSQHTGDWARRVYEKCEDGSISCTEVRLSDEEVAQIEAAEARKTEEIFREVEERMVAVIQSDFNRLEGKKPN